MATASRSTALMSYIARLSQRTDRWTTYVSSLGDMTELSFFDNVNATNKPMRRLILVLAMAVLTFRALCKPKVEVQAQADPAVSGDRESTSKTGAIVWTELILYGDGTINWTEYENVAA